MTSTRRRFSFIKASSWRGPEGEAMQVVHSCCAGLDVHKNVGFPACDGHWLATRRGDLQESANVCGSKQNESFPIPRSSWPEGGAGGTWNREGLILFAPTNVGPL